MSCGRPRISNAVVKSVFKQVPVTCVKFLEKHIIGAIGGDLHLYESHNQVCQQFKRVLVVPVFSSINIYGIILQDLKILVYGAKNLAVLDTNENFSSFSIEISWTTEDWVLDCIWVNNFKIAVLTAHNALLLYQCSPTLKLLNKISCIDKSILYSGKILNSKWKELIVLSGTVYQEIVIWSSGKSVSQECSVIHRLKGHKGVIFSVSYDEETQRICSTSDDRTVRVWSITFPSTENLVEKWVNAQINLSFSAFGHTARVWKSLFLPEGRLLSIGEDSQMCLWSKGGDLLTNWDHNGDIWCLDYNNSWVIVGGNGITIRSILPLPPTSSVTLGEQYGTMKNAVMSFNGNRIIITDKGKLILFGKDVIDSIEDKKLYSYCILSISPCRSYAITGGIFGDVILYKDLFNVLVLENKFLKLSKLKISGRVYSLSWADDKTIVANGVDGILYVQKLKHSCDGANFEPINEFILPSSKERWITCTILICDYLICGDRMGSVHLYTLCNRQKDPLDSLNKLHDVKGVTDIKYVNDIIYSIGRDGSLREMDIIGQKLTLLSTLKLPMDWAASIIYSKSYGLIVMGFYGPDFVLWNVEKRITLLRFDCGGGHRSFDCNIDDSSRNLVINYIRKKEMKYFSCLLDRISHQTVHEGYHTKAINCSCLLSIEEEYDCVLTGSEDNSIILCTLGQSSCKISSAYLRHISSIRAASVADDVLVTAGGRAQMILWQIQRYSGETRLMEIDSYMIRDESKLRRPWKKAVPLIDPEMRYMDLEICKQNDGSYRIFSSCSDGLLRIFNYNKEESKLSLVKSLESHQGCLLKLSVFDWNNELVVLTAGTKGSVCFWYAPHDTSPSHSHTLHSSGINSMDLLIEKKHVVLATGGDDTVVILSAFSLGNNKKETLTFSLKEHIHSCQVNGLKITLNYVISIGMDQKLCILKWEFDGNYFKTSLLCWFNASVLDIHGLQAWPVEKDLMKIMIFGKGFEVLHFDASAISKPKNL